MSNETRKGCKDVWNAFMCDGAVFAHSDIPHCPTTATELPKSIINWEEAKAIYKKHRIKGETDFYNDSYVRPDDLSCRATKSNADPFRKAAL